MSPARPSIEWPVADAGYPTACERHNDDKREGLASLGDLNCRAVLEALLTDAMIGLALREGEHSICEPWVDLLVLAKILRCGVRRASEAEALPDHRLTGHRASLKRRVCVNDFRLSKGDRR